MNHMDKSLEQTAMVCAVCHDQCVSTCPVFESTRRLSAYPSRLAMLALELNRGGIPAKSPFLQSMRDCIGCGACMEGCLYADKPNDVTPVVRWARGAARSSLNNDLGDWFEKIKKYGTPFEDTRDRLSALKSSLANPGPGKPVLVLLDSATLHYAPKMAASILQLLAKIGYENIILAEQAYLGFELREQGWQEEFIAIAHEVDREFTIAAPAQVITAHPLSAYMLREVYPKEAGIQLNIPVYSLAEILYKHADHLPQPKVSNVYLLQCAVESFRMGGGVARQLLESRGWHVFGPRPDNLQYRDMSYPDGEVIGIDPDPRELIRKRIYRSFARSRAIQIVTTSPEALNEMQEEFSDILITDLATFFYE